MEKNVEKNLDDELGISFYFRKMGYFNIAKVKGLCYPAFIDAFYANMTEKSKDGIRTFDTEVQGDKVHVKKSDNVIALNVIGWTSEGLLEIDLIKSGSNIPMVGFGKKKKASYAIDTSMNSLHLQWE